MTKPTPKRLVDLRAENIEKSNQLAASGAALHPMAIMQAHLTVLVEGLGYSYELEQEFEKLLDAAAVEVAQSKLAHGLHLPTS